MRAKMIKKSHKRSVNQFLKIIMIVVLVFPSLGIYSADKVIDEAEAAGGNTIGDLGDFFAAPTGDSSIDPNNPNQVIIVPDERGQQGSIWSKEKISFKQSFTMKTMMNLGGSVEAADGITLSFQNVSSSYAGDGGSYMGVYNFDSRVSDMLVIEFDIYANIPGSAYPVPGFEIKPDGSNYQGPHFSIEYLDDQTYPSTIANAKAGADLTTESITGGKKAVDLTWDASTNLMTVSVEDSGTISATISDTEIEALFGPSQEAYIGYTGSTGAQSGFFTTEFESFSYDNYLIEDTQKIYHADGVTEVTSANPAHKGETLHVKETIKNSAALSDNYTVKYSVDTASNFDKDAIKNFKVNGDSATYVDDYPISLTGTNTATVEFDIVAQQLTGTFTDPTSTHKVSYTSKILSPIGLPEIFSSPTVPTANDAPTWGSGNNIVIQKGSTAPNYVTASGLTASDQEDGAVTSNITVDSSAVNTNVLGVYPVVFSVTDLDNKPAATTITKSVAVTPNGATDIDATKPYIYAPDKIVTKGSTVDLREGMFAFDMKDGDLTSATTYTVLGPNNETTFNSRVTGTWKVTFSVTDSDLNKTTEEAIVDVVNVISGDVAISASPFTVDASEVAGLTEASVIAKANAKAWQVSTGATVPVTANYSAIQAKPGVYDVVFTAGGISTTVKATVKDKDTTVDPNNDVLIYGKGFAVEQGASLSDAEIITKSGAYAKKLSDGTDVTVTVQRGSLDTNTVGVYDVTLTTALGGSHVIKVNVVKTGTVISPDSSNTVYAEQAVVDQATARTLTSEASLRTINKVVAKTNGTDTSADVGITTGDWNAIKAGTEGSYDVTYSLGTIGGDDFAAKSVKITVVKDGSIVSPDGKNSVYAESVVVSQLTAKTLTTEDTLRAVNKVVASSNGISAPAIVSITSGNWDAIKNGTVGSYDVTYSLGTNGNPDYATKTVKITVVKDGTIISPDGKNGLYAENVAMTLAAANALADKNALISATKAAVTLSDGTTTAPILSDADYLAVKNATGSGKVTLQFSYGSGTGLVTDSVEVTITDDGSKTSISGINGIVTVTEAKALANKEALIAVNDVEVTTGDGSHPAPIVTAASWNDIKAGTIGIYDINYAFGPKSVTLKVSVVADGSEGSIDGTNSIYAQDVIVDKVVAATLTSEASLRAITKEYSINNGNKVDAPLTIDGTDWANLKAGVEGSYDVKYTLGTVGQNDYVSKTATIEVRDRVVVVPANNETIGANDFILATDDVATVTNADLIALAEAEAINTATGETVEITTVDKTALQAKPGVYDVKFATTKGTSVTVKATVKDQVVVVPANNEAISANDFMLDKDQVATITDTELIQLAKAEAVNTETGVPVAITTVDKTGLQAQVGVYDVIFKTAKGTSVTVTATVKDNVVVVPANKEAIGANDFMLDKDQVATITDAELIDLANAEAVDTETGAAVAVTSVNRTALQPALGVYDVTFATTKGTSVTVKAAVKDNIVIVPDNKEAIGANDFMLTKDQVATVTDAELINLANAEAFNTDTGASVPIITVDKTDIEAKVGVYDVTFSTEKGTSVTVKATVKDQVVIVPGNNEAIGANDFILAKSQVTTVTDAELIDLANAEAMNIDTGAAVAVTTVDKTNLKPENGVYNVTFATAKGTSITVKATVKDQVVIVPGNKEIVGANDFMLQKDQIASISDAELISLANAEAFNTDTGELVAITTVDKSALQAIPGVYNVSFATAKGTSTTVKATVKDNVIVSPNNKEAIGANNFMLQKDQVATVTDAELIELANAEAMDTETGVPVAVTSVDKTDLKAEIGIYNVKFATTKGTSITVKAAVKDEVVVVPGNKEIIGANDFMISKDQVSTVTDAELIDLAHAEAVDTETGAIVAITTIDKTALKAEPGVYNVSFATTKGTSITVKATVKDNVVIVPANGEAIGANNFMLAKDQVSTITDAELIDLAHAEAVDTVTGAKVAITTVDKTDLEARPGVYDVKYATTKGTTITVKAAVKDDVVVAPANQEAIGANNFVIGKSEVATVTDAKLIELAGAEAVDTETGASVAITAVDKSKLQAQAGVYDVSFATAKGTSITVKATVKDEDSTVDPSKDVLIYGHGFTVEQGTTLTDAQILTNSGAFAKKLSDGTDVTVSVESRGILDTNTAGKYDVKLTSALGGSHTISVTVMKTGTVISPDYSNTVYAESVVVDQTKAKTLLTEDTLRAANKVVATTDGATSIANVDITDENWNAIKAGTAGSYDITYYLGTSGNPNYAAKTVKITIVKDGNIISPDEKNSLYAEDVTMSLAAANALADKNALITATSAVVTLSNGTTTVPNLADGEYLAVKNATIPGTKTLNYSYGSGTGLVTDSVAVTITDDGSQTTITGSNAVLTETEAKSLVNKEALIAVNKVVVTVGDDTHPAPIVTATGWEAIKAGTIGSYDVTYAFGPKTATFKLNVVADGSGVSTDGTNSIYAQNAIVDKTTAATLTTEASIRAVTKEYSTNNGIKIDAPLTIDAADWTNLKAGVEGSYDVTYTLGTVGQGNYVTKTASIIVKDHVVVIPANNETIGANDFMLATDKVATISDADLIALAKAEALNTTTGAKVAITTVDKSALKGEPGVYDVTFATAKGTSITVKATVKDQVIVSPENKEAIGASGFMIDKDDVATVSDATLIDLANAEAVNTETGSAVAITTVDKSGLKAELGIYDVTFATEAGTSITVKATVKDNVIISPENGEAIGANDFTLAKDQVATITDTEIIDLASAEAVDIMSGSSVAITSVDKSKLQSETGVYDVTFATTKGTSVTVKATVRDKVVIDPEEKELIAANDFMVDKDEVATITDADLIKKAKAVAVNTETGASVAITSVDKTKLKAAPGVYDVKFATTKGTSVTVKAAVKDNVVVSPENGEAIGANDFMLAKDEVATINDAGLINRAKAEAVDTTTGAPVAITTVDKSALKAETGVYNVKFATAKGTSVTVKAVVKDDVIVSPDNKETIGANDFMLAKDEVATVTDSYLISAAKAEASDTETGASVAVTTVDKSELEAETGVYNVTFATAKGTSVTVKATVRDNVIVAPENNELISANNFMVDRARVANISDEDLIKLAKAEAVDTKTGSSVEITTVDKSALQSELGVYDVTFATAKGTSITVKATVKDQVIINPENGEAIGANDFMLAKDQVAAITDADLIDLAKVEAVDISTGKSVAVTTVDKAALQSETGVYDITFATAKGTSVTVKATVKDSLVVDPENGETIGANDFILSKDEVAEASDATLIGSANAEAIETTTGKPVPITTVDRAGLQAVVGEYDVTFATAKGTNTTVGATVKENVVISPENKEVIGANNFILAKDQVATVTDADLIKLAKAEAMNTETGEIVAVTTVDKSQLQAETGVYAVTFATAKGTSVTANAIVKDNVVISPENGEAIGANDFILAKADVATISNADLIKLAKAEAVNTNTGEPVAVTNVDKSDLQAETGVYDVTFTTAKGTSITVKATVKDNVVINPNNQEAIGANDFMLAKAEVATISDAALIELAKAEAVNTATGEPVTVTTVDKSNLRAETGVYDVTFATVKGTSITVKATVKENVVVNPENGEAIGANDFMLAKDEVATITSANLIELAKAEAVDLETGKPITITTIDKSNLRAEPGVYDVTFATAKGTSITVKATVKDHVVIDLENGEAIGADDITLDKNEVATISDAALIELAHAEAVSTVTGASVPVTTVDKSNLRAKAGVYDLTFATAVGTSVTPKATIEDHDDITPVPSKGALAATGDKTNAACLYLLLVISLMSMVLVGRRKKSMDKI